MKRLIILLAMTALVLAAAAGSALVEAQVAPDDGKAVPKEPPPKQSKEVRGPQSQPNRATVVPSGAAPVAKQVGPAAKPVAAPKATSREAAAKKVVAEVKKAEVIENTPAIKQAIRARNRRIAVVNANANLNPIAQQYVQQGRPMMRSEVLLVYTLFHPSKDVLKGLVKNAESALEAVAKEMAEFQQGGRRVMVQGRHSNNPEWCRRLQETIAAEFKKHLTADQFARYQSEVEKRFAERKAAGVRFLVDAIDRELLLSPRQREELIATLGPKWEEGWSTYLEYIMYGNEFFPQEVDRLVTVVLDDTQKKVWQGTQKVGGFWGFGGIWNFQNGEDPLQRLLDEGTAKPAEKVQLPAAAMQKRAIAKPARKND
jgi:hypothetical protein